MRSTLRSCSAVDQPPRCDAPSSTHGAAFRTSRCGERFWSSASPANTVPGGSNMKGMIVAAVSLCAVVAGSRMLAAPGQATARPGDPTQARVFIENRSDSEAIPVTLENFGDARPLKVDVWGTPTVTVAPTTTVRVAATRQLWEYRLLPLPAGAEAESALRQAGNDSWEAVSMQQGAGGLVALLKRPRM